MPEYIVELADGVYNFYLPLEAVDTDWNPVTIKSLKFSKTIERIDEEIATYDVRIAKITENADEYLAVAEAGKAKKVAIKALMV